MMREVRRTVSLTSAEKKSDLEPFVHCNHLPGPTETNTQTIQQTQGETIVECCIDDVWDQQHDQEEDEPKHIHDMVVSNRACMIEFGNESCFFVLRAPEQLVFELLSDI